MAQYDTVRCGSAFREDSLVLVDDYGQHVDIDLLVKGDVIYLFDRVSKTLMKEILIMRDFSVEAGTAPQSLILRDQTKEVVLKAKCESSKTNCITSLHRLANTGISPSSPKPDGPPLYHAEPVTVVFRNPQLPSFTNSFSSMGKPKSLLPPPIAPKPFSAKTLPRSFMRPATQDQKVSIASGKVKAMSRDLEKVLFVTPPMVNRNVNQYPIEKKPDPVPESESNEYEPLNATWPQPPRLPQPSRVPSDPRMQDELPPIAELRIETSSPQSTVREPVKQKQFDEELAQLYDNQIDTKAFSSPNKAPAEREYQNRMSDLKVTEDDADMYASNIEIRRPWLMFGHPTRQAAVKALKGKPDGSFVVRSRDGPDADMYPYALTVLYKDHPIHIQIQRTETAGLVLAPWKAGEKAFETLDDLVQYYRDNRLAFVYHNMQGFISLQKENFAYD